MNYCHIYRCRKRIRTLRWENSTATVVLVLIMPSDTGTRESGRETRPRSSTSARLSDLVDPIKIRCCKRERCSIDYHPIDVIDKVPPTRRMVKKITEHFVARNAHLRTNTYHKSTLHSVSNGTLPHVQQWDVLLHTLGC